MSFIKMLRKKFKLFSNKKLRIKYCGKDNYFDIAKNVNYGKISIYGNNNFIQIAETVTHNKLNIIIFGNNNQIIIGKTQGIGQLNIYCGNALASADNTSLEIKDDLSMVSSDILLFNTNNKCIIGKNCLFSKNIQIRCGESPHLIFDKETGENLDVSDGVIIGDHCWIGENTFIMKRVKIPTNSIVAAASVVTKAFEEEFTLIAGNPAAVRKKNIKWQKDKNSI